MKGGFFIQNIHHFDQDYAEVGAVNSAVDGAVLRGVSIKVFTLRVVRVWL